MKYTKLYALMLDGGILTEANLRNYWYEHQELTKSNAGERWFGLSGSGTKRVFFNKGGATAEFNRMPKWLKNVVTIHEFTSTAVIQ